MQTLSKVYPISMIPLREFMDHFEVLTDSPTLITSVPFTTFDSHIPFADNMLPQIIKAVFCMFRSQAIFLLENVFQNQKAMHLVIH